MYQTGKTGTDPRIKVLFTASAFRKQVEGATVGRLWRSKISLASPPTLTACIVPVRRGTAFVVVNHKVTTYGDTG